MNNLMKTVLELMPQNEEGAITGRELVKLTGLSRRKLKAVITELRKEYPICAKETDGGGYWLAENREDVRRFIMMIANRREGYNRTIWRMQKHLENYDF